MLATVNVTGTFGAEQGKGKGRVREGGKGGKKGRVYCRSREERSQSSSRSWCPEVPWIGRRPRIPSHEQTELREREGNQGKKEY